MLKKLFKFSVIYGLGGVTSKAVLFLTIPIFTRLFSPEYYGRIELLNSLTMFLGIVLTCGMDSAQSFFFYKNEERDPASQAKLVTAILQWRFVWGICIIAIALTFAPVINEWIFDGQESLVLFVIVFLGAWTFQAMGQGIEIYRLVHRPYWYISLNLVNAVLTIGLALIFIYIADLGITGYFLGYLTSALLAGFLSWGSLREYLDFSAFHRDWWLRLMKFGGPLVPGGIALVIMLMADRWFIQFFVGAETVGLYAVAGQFAMALGLIVNAFRQAWWPMAMEAVQTEDGKDSFRVLARVYLGFGGASVIVLTGWAPWILSWLVPQPYWSSYTLIGPLAWYPVFYGFYLISSPGLWKMERMDYASGLMIAAGTLNIVLNWIAVPRWGSLGAAMSTSISFFVWNLGVIWLSERLWKVDFPYFFLLGQVAWGITGTFVVYQTYQQTLSFPITMSLSLVIAILVSASALPLKSWGRMLSRFKASA